MANRDLVVIGASAGGLEALQQLNRALPVDLEAAVLVVLHTSNHVRSLLPQIVSRGGRLQAIHPEDGMPLQKGRIYIAPPDFHMFVEDNRVRLVRGPRENLHRPAIDPLFRSAAKAYGRRAIGVVLTGLLDDGTSGLMALHASGGAAVVQDPADAMFSSMPASALRHVPGAHVLPLKQIPELLARLVQEQISPRPSPVPESTIAAAKETKIAEFDMSEIENEARLGQPSVFACPDCGGVLWELNQNGFVRFRCRVGHAYTRKNLAAQQRQAIEGALWAALRALEENASLYRELAARARESHRENWVAKYEEWVAKKEDDSRLLRDLLLQLDAEEDDAAEDDAATG